MNIKNRIRILKKIAQAATPVVDTTKPSVSGSPPGFNPATLYPSVIIGLSQKNISPLSQLVDLMNQALYYSSDGKIHLSWMKSVNFNFDTSSASSVDLKNLMLLSKLIYQNLLTNNGLDYKSQLSPTDIEYRVNTILNSQPLSNLSSTNAKGQLESKIGGNLKELIRSHLMQIK